MKKAPPTTGVRAGFTTLGRRVCVAWLGAALIAGPATGHETRGNRVSTVTRVDIDVDGLSGSYEIQYGGEAALPIRYAMDGNGDGFLDISEQRAFMDSVAATWSTGLTLVLDAEPQTVKLAGGEVIPRGGATAMAVPMAILYSWRLPLSFRDGTRVLVLRETNEHPGLVHRTAVISTGDLLRLNFSAGADVKGLQLDAGSEPLEAMVAFDPVADAWRSGSTGGEALTPVGIWLRSLLWAVVLYGNP